MASVRIGIHLAEPILDELKPYVEAAVETGLLSESEAIQVVVDSLLASLQRSVETVEE